MHQGPTHKDNPASQEILPAVMTSVSFSGWKWRATCSSTSKRSASTVHLAFFLSFPRLQHFNTGCVPDYIVGKRKREPTSRAPKFIKSVCEVYRFGAPTFGIRVAARSES